MNRAERRELMATMRKLTGRKVSFFSYPGGRSRKSFRVHFADGGTAIATRRRTSARRDHELDVMRALAAHGAPVARILGVRGDLMLQEDLGETRLSEHLYEIREQPDQIAEALDRAVDALAVCHDAAASAGLADRCKVIGADAAWIEGLIRCPGEIEDALGIAVPDYSTEPLQSLLRVREPSFVKWDSRPGNALLRDGRAFWFDWEHSGARNAIDDLIWVLCDEFVTFRPRMEETILLRHLDRFRGSLGSADEAHDYFAGMATCHSVVRLSLIVSNKKDGPWWSTRYCLEGDKVGVTLRCARRLVRRGAAWAERLSHTQPLAGWFRDLEGHLETV